MSIEAVLAAPNGGSRRVHAEACRSHSASHGQLVLDVHSAGDGTVTLLTGLPANTAHRG
jgi:hypothetical protein